MGIRSRNVKKTATIGYKPFRLALGTTATGQTAKKVDGVTIPFPFQIVSAEVDALTVVSTFTVDVQIGTTSALAAAVTPVAATPTACPLSATVANTQSTSSSSVLSLLYTSGASGAATNGYVTVWIRPLGMEGDPISVAE